VFNLEEIKRKLNCNDARYQFGVGSIHGVSLGIPTYVAMPTKLFVHAEGRGVAPD
jgi:hypothetical protein